MSVALTQHIHGSEPISVLSIAGSDSGGGAGIQADLKTFAAHRVHGLSAVAALTAQNTRGVDAVHAPPPEFLARQIDTLFADFRIGATKIGMLASADLVGVVCDALQRHGANNIVLDPVMVASSGASLLAPDAVESLRSRLLPLAGVLTPNLPEAEALLGVPVRARDDMRAAAQALLRLGPRAVLLKGGHLPHGDLIDLYLDAEGEVAFQHPRLDLEGHGTGCTLSSAIASGLALGLAPREACREACDYVHGALAHATRPGRGSVTVLDHFWRFEPRA
jgi:hydroxymethylpyrimidine/phosphomethylpyrimidine kinase